MGSGVCLAVWVLCRLSGGPPGGAFSLSPLRETTSAPWPAPSLHKERPGSLSLGGYCQFFSSGDAVSGFLPLNPQPSPAPRGALARMAAFLEGLPAVPWTKAWGFWAPPSGRLQLRVPLGMRRGPQTAPSLPGGGHLWTSLIIFLAVKSAAPSRVRVASAIPPPPGTSWGWRCVWCVWPADFHTPQAGAHSVPGVAGLPLHVGGQFPRGARPCPVSPGGRCYLQ